MKLPFVFIIALFSLQREGSTALVVTFQWKYLDWVWPIIPLTGKNFTLGSAFTQDVDIDKRGRVFVTSPQWSEGVPVTLSTLTNTQGPGGPLLAPYPNWSWHTPYSCESLVSVYRIAIDECNRLWVVDTGRVEMKTVCPTKILIFDLDTDLLMHKYVVPDDQVLYGQGSLVTPIVDIGKTCLDTVMYIADVSGNGIVVYDFHRDRSFRVNNTRGNAFGPDTDAMNITIAGEWFDLTDGTLGMSLSPYGFFSERYLYFNSLASYYQKFTNTRSLRQSEFVEPEVFQSNYKRPSQAGVQATSRRGVLFFQLVQETAIACWNIRKPFTPDNIVTIAQDEETLQYVSGIKVIPNKYGEEELWFNTNRLQKTINNSRKTDEMNFRIINGKVDDIIAGTKCEPDDNFQTAQRFLTKPDTSYWRRI